jgi:hypothetical protein
VGNEGVSVPARTHGERLRAIAPWLLCLAVFGGGAVTLDGVERATAVGAFAAASIGALLAVSQLRRALLSMQSWMGDRESALSTFADDRAAAVARQFQWAVEELVGVRAELRKVEGLRVKAEQRAARVADEARRDAEDLRVTREKLGALDASELDLLREKLEQAEQAMGDGERDRRNAERRARAAEQRVADLTRTLRLVANTVSSGGDVLAPHATPSGPLTLDWTLEYDGSAHSLRLRSTSADVRPGKARILDATGRPVAESLGTRHRRPAQVVLRIPQSVAAAVESGDWSAFRLEVEVDEVWHGAVLVDRSQPVIDAQAPRQAAFRVVS